MEKQSFWDDLVYFHYFVKKNSKMWDLSGFVVVLKNHKFSSEQILKWVEGLDERSCGYLVYKTASKKCHGIILLEIADIQPVSTCKFPMYSATPKHATES